MSLEKVKAQILWVSGYYDGPIDGAALVDDEVVWFSMIEDYEVIGTKIVMEEGEEFEEAIWSPRRWGLYRLTDEEFRLFTTNHLLFEVYVGTHHCNHSPGEVKDRSLHMKFYDNYQGYDRSFEGREPFAEMIR